jgi:hypothetical protein
MTARPGGCVTASEIQVFAEAPGVASDAGAASVEVSGTPVTRPSEVPPRGGGIPGAEASPGVSVGS